MKIFCKSCNRYVFDTSSKFVMGGPYDGSMFQPVAGVNGYPYRPAYQKRMNENMKKGNLKCPMCFNRFVWPDGSVMTGHGRVRAGQETVDERILFYHEPGFRLKSRGWSTEILEDRVRVAQADRQKTISEMFGDEIEEFTVEEGEKADEEPKAGEKGPEEPKKYGNDIEKRNRKILRMHNSGKTYRKIARKFGLSPHTIGVIVRSLKNGASEQG